MQGSTQVRILPVLLIAAVASCVLPQDRQQENGVQIGLLLPFTGKLAGNGASIERAVMMAADDINAAGGIAGEPIALETRDTHSQRRAGLEAGRQLIEESSVVGMIGPENETLATLLLPLVKENRVVQVCGGVTSPSFRDFEDEDFWFRTNPSLSTHGSVLADRMRADGVQSVAIVHVQDQFGLGFGRVMSAALEQRGIAVGVPITFNPTERNFDDVIFEIAYAEADAVALAADATSGAKIVQEWSLLNIPVRWYLAHSLRQEVFAQNIPDHVVGSAVGVAGAISGGHRLAFEKEFGKRWFSETPSIEVYFYYDAMAVMGLALARAQRSEDGLARDGNLRTHLRFVSNPPGKKIQWNQLDQALQYLEQGHEIDYQGVSGDVNFDAAGDREQGRAALWGIRQHAIVDL